MSGEIIGTLGALGRPLFLTRLELLDVDWLSNPEIWAALISLTAMEIVLGIDNIVFISILSGRLPIEHQAKARLWGLALAMVTRVMLLASLTWVMQLTRPLFGAHGHEFSGRDLILIGGGAFLLMKSTREIHERIEGVNEARDVRMYPTLASVLVQIMFLDIIFSLDSVITAVGMANDLWVMITAVMIAVLVMMAFSKVISDFIHANPTVKMLALSFLLLIGVVLVADGFGQHIDKGYIYAAMAFSLFVEMLNIRVMHKQRKRAPLSASEKYIQTGLEYCPDTIGKKPREIL
ncbi:MAG TPA: TerC family protein [Candidatus Obscuribacterales bacterium]